MTPELQAIIEAAQKLTLQEQLELINAVSESLRLQVQRAAVSDNFWNSKTLDVMTQEQGAKTVKKIADLAVDYWPEHDTTDELIDYIYQQRQEDRLP